MRSIGRLFRIASTILMIILITLTGVVGYIIRSPMPQTAGAIRAEGLQNEVAIYRDTWGVPHIYAESAHDLFFAQGYVHAQDRLWQMEFNRRVGSGRLSEVLGRGALGNDLFIRAIGWQRAAEADVKRLGKQELDVLQWDADGVNAFLAPHRDNLPL